MADLFPDTILNILCEEYSDSSRKRTEDNSEVRMKLGEVLLRVSKGLGEFLLYKIKVGRVRLQ